MNNFTLRSLTGAGFVVVMLGSALLGQLVFSVLFLVVSLLGLFEFYGLFKKHSPFSPFSSMAIVAGALLYALLALNALGYLNGSLILLILPILFLLFIAELWRVKTEPFINIAISLAGILYIPLPLGLAIYFFDPISLSGPEHFGTMIGFLLILWLNDTGAYIVGSLIGKHKLFSRISPGKTWEGSKGGALFALLVAYLCSVIFPIYPLWKWLVMGLIIVITGTLGDLVESMMKRSLQVKDSGNILPGHGGILDRFDAVLISVPFVFVFLTLTR
ncbi:MAG: phosphatidate cytidylyltransferase [Bacteroidales bacterium]|nr:phosphatidate cytidylyltransferase [Bacteroidales bacterium]